jgi:predicted Fe-Mo cluster-binding NifX family protein
MKAQSSTVGARRGRFASALYSGIALALLVVGAATAQEHRVALVIGNAAYMTGALKNPVNDARAMAAALRNLGFEVLIAENVGRKAMLQKLREYRDTLRPDSVGLFYYAGHGIQVRGQNYLIPVDAVVRSEAEIDEESVNLGHLLDRLDEAKNGINIVILDACRDNPFGRSFRSASRGLAQVDAPIGTLIAYATAPGRTASDGEGANGTYTEEMLRVLKTPGLKVEDVLKRVRAGVVRRTNGLQTPWDASSLIGDFFFIPVSAVALVAPVAEPRIPLAESVAPTRIAAVPPSALSANVADGVWSLFMQCSGLMGWNHSLLGRRVTDGKLVGRTATHDSPETWSLAFNMPSPDRLEVVGTLTDARGRSGRYAGTATGSDAAFKGAGKFDNYDCAFEARRIR